MFAFDKDVVKGGGGGAVLGHCPQTDELSNDPEIMISFT